MKINREHILDIAFDEYLKHGYSGVSITVLQERLGIGRATMYYYFKNKAALFCAVIDKYFFEAMECNLALPDTLSLKMMIETRVQALCKVRSYIVNSGSPQVTMSNMASLLMEAYMRYPKYREQGAEIRQRVQLLWEKAIRNSVAYHEIRDDVNVPVLASMFANIKDSYESGFSCQNIREKDAFFETSYQYLYDLIKI